MAWSRLNPPSTNQIDEMVGVTSRIKMEQVWVNNLGKNGRIGGFAWIMDECGYDGHCPWLLIEMNQGKFGEGRRNKTVEKKFLRQMRVLVEWRRDVSYLKEWWREWCQEEGLDHMSIMSSLYSQWRVSLMSNFYNLKEMWDEMCFIIVGIWKFISSNRIDAFNWFVPGP